MRKQQQAGIVSIIVATLLIVIVSLIVVAFAQISRREQRESLDAQLSTQAYYAAETGVNAAKARIQNLMVSDPAALDTPQPECHPATGPFSDISYDLSDASAPSSVAITCLTVNPTPPDLSYQLKTDSATIVPIVPKSGGTIVSLTFTWPKSAGFTADQNACKSMASGGVWTLPIESTWNTVWKCPFAAIRADFVPVGSLHRDDLLNNDNVSFMLPSGAGNGNGILNDVSSAQCTTSCRVTFNVSGLNSRSMYLRLLSLYQGGESVTITGTDSTGGAIGFTNAQAKIDSTGRAQDVLRRILVSVPLQSGPAYVPAQALVSGDSVCKRFGVFTGFYQNYAPAASGCQ